jgi:hypothetical protein
MDKLRGYVSETVRSAPVRPPEYLAKNRIAVATIVSAAPDFQAPLFRHQCNLCEQWHLRLDNKQKPMKRYVSRHGSHCSSKAETRKAHFIIDYGNYLSRTLFYLNFTCIPIYLTFLQNTIIGYGLTAFRLADSMYIR